MVEGSGMEAEDAPLALPSDVPLQVAEKVAAPVVVLMDYTFFPATP